MADVTVPISRLWSRLRDMENEKRFDGQAYPVGMCPSPFRLVGQGFFPGGDGLWRNETDLGASSQGSLALAGITFLANDFGTLGSYMKLRSKGYENPLTWKHVKQRVLRADLPQSNTFFTNAVMGLRTDGPALGKRDWANKPLFGRFCEEFLEFQIQTLKPRLVVVLGPVARSTLEYLTGAKTSTTEMYPVMKIAGHTATFHYDTHPYGDFNFNEQRKANDAIRLRNAWIAAQTQFSN